MKTDAQRRAKNKYEREKVKSMTLKFYPKDHQLYNWIKSQDNSAGYIKELVAKDMESQLANKE